MLKNNASEDQLLKLIERTLCNATGAFSAECKTLIDTYGPSILQYLAQGVDPTKLCELIQMCPKDKSKSFSYEVLRNRIRFPKTPEIKKFKLAPRNELYCTMCQYTMEFIDHELEKDQTEQALVNVLASVCKLSPASTQQECHFMIQNYGLYMVELLIQLADPLKVCQAVKLC